MTIFLGCGFAGKYREAAILLAGLLAGGLAQFCAAFYDPSFDFDFGDELLRNRG